MFSSMRKYLEFKGNNMLTGDETNVDDKTDREVGSFIFENVFNHTKLYYIS